MERYISSAVQEWGGLASKNLAASFDVLRTMTVKILVTVYCDVIQTVQRRIIRSQGIISWEGYARKQSGLI